MAPDFETALGGRSANIDIPLFSMIGYPRTQYVVWIYRRGMAQ